MLYSALLDYGLRGNTRVCVFKSTVFVGKDKSFRAGPYSAPTDPASVEL